MSLRRHHWFERRRRRHLRFERGSARITATTNGRAVASAAAEGCRKRGVEIAAYPFAP
jgi:hypothetical protein